MLVVKAGEEKGNCRGIRDWVWERVTGGRGMGKGNWGEEYGKG